MPYYQRGDASIYYEEYGPESGVPLLLIAPGGMNSAIAFWGRMPFNPIDSYQDEFRVIAMDQRNTARSSGPLDLEDPWAMYVDDQVGLMDHLGIQKFLVMGSCIGCSFILKMCEMYPDRVLAGVMEQPIGTDESNAGTFGRSGRIFQEWSETLLKSRSDVTAEQVDTFGKAMWDGDYIFSIPKESIPSIQNQLLVMPGIDLPHPTAVGLELAKLLPNAELLEKWKEPPEIVPQTVEHVRQYLKAHSPAGVA